jgi:hypothetical protein
MSELKKSKLLNIAEEIAFSELDEKTYNNKIDEVKKIIKNKE